MKPEKKERILSNAGKAIGKIMTLKKVTAPVLSKKSGMKISDVNDITTGKKLPTKEELKSMYKALDVPKEVVLLYSIEEQDVTPKKRKIFNDLMPSIKGLVEGMIKDDAKKSSKKQVLVNKSVKTVTTNKKLKTKKVKK